MFVRLHQLRCSCCPRTTRAGWLGEVDGMERSPGLSANNASVHSLNLQYGMSKKVGNLRFSFDMVLSKKYPEGKQVVAKISLIVQYGTS